MTSRSNNQFDFVDRHTNLPISIPLQINTSNIGLGIDAGSINQSYDTVAIGTEAAENNQQFEAVAIGNRAGKNTQGGQAVSVGFFAGSNFQGAQAVSIGCSAGTSSQGAKSIAIGFESGNANQSTDSISIGNSAGKTSQSQRGVAIGQNAGSSVQGPNSISIGYNSGQTSQLQNAVAIGHAAGNANQGDNTVAIGHFSGQSSQGNHAIAIGQNAGQTSQGANAIAIGQNAGVANQHARSIILNASGSTINSTGTDRLIINPVRLAVGTRNLRYNSGSFEISQAENVQQFAPGNVHVPGSLCIGEVQGQNGGFPNLSNGVDYQIAQISLGVGVWMIWGKVNVFNVAPSHFRVFISPGTSNVAGAIVSEASYGNPTGNAMTGGTVPIMYNVTGSTAFSVNCHVSSPVSNLYSISGQIQAVRFA